jgi:hypothetical protein
MYDPWEGYRQATRTLKHEVPYQSLLHLLRTLELQPVLESLVPLRGFGIKPETAANLCSWCAQHGLLGILPQRVQSVVPAPRWEPNLFQARGTKKTFTPTLRQYSRTCFGWRTNIQAPHWRGEVKRRNEELVADKDLPPKWPKPYAVIQDLGKHECSHEPLALTWARFFPAVPKGEEETYFYPQPLSDGFWREYAEPVTDFLSGAALLQATLEGLGTMNNLRDTAGATGPEQFLQVRVALETLNAVVGTIALGIRVGQEGSFQQQWIAPSLFASYALMALQDLTRQRRVLRCIVCGRLFLSKAHAARYCGLKCRHTSQKRAYRERKRNTIRGKLK